MKKAIVVLVALTILALAPGSLAFQNEPDGFRGLKWGDPPSEDMVIDQEGRNASFNFGRFGSSMTEPYMSCYRSNDDQLYIGPAELSSISYVFYEGRFMMVEIWTDWFEGEDLESVLMLKFGESQDIKSMRRARVKYGEVDYVTYIWLGEKVRIEFERKFRWSGSGNNRTSMSVEDSSLKMYSVWILDEWKEVQEGEQEERRQEKEEAIRKGLDDF